MKSTELEKLVIRIVGDNKQYISNMLESVRVTQASAKDIERSLTVFDRFKQGMAMAAGGIVAYAGFAAAQAGFGGLNSTIEKSIQLAKEQEQAMMSFEVLTGSLGQAKALLKEMREYASSNPFTLPQIRGATQQMMQYGMSAKEAINMVKMVGDVAAGDANKLSGMGYAMAQIRSAGHLMGQDLRQMINWGFNPLEEMSRTTGKSMAELTDKMHKGEISSLDVANAFKTATGEGGKFYKMSEKQAATFGGLMSTMEDTMTFALTDIGQKIIDTFHLKEILKKAIDEVAYWSDFVMQAMSQVKGFVDQHWNSIAGTIGGWYESFKRNLTAAIGFFMNFGENSAIIMKWVKENWTILCDNIGSLWENFSTAAKNNLFTFVRTGIRLFVMFTGFMTSEITRGAKAVINVFYTIGTSVKEVFDEMWSGNFEAGARLAIKNVGRFFLNETVKWANDWASFIRNPAGYAINAGARAVVEDQMTKKKIDDAKKQSQGILAAAVLKAKDLRSQGKDEEANAVMQQAYKESEDVLKGVDELRNTLTDFDKMKNQVSGAIDMALRDFEAGGNGEGLMAEAEKILEEESKKLESFMKNNPFTALTGLNFEIPALTAGGEAEEELKDFENKALETTKKLGKQMGKNIGGPVDAAIYDSAEALARYAEFRSGAGAEQFDTGHKKTKLKKEKLFKMQDVELNPMSVSDVNGLQNGEGPKRMETAADVVATVLPTLQESLAALVAIMSGGDSKNGLTLVPVNLTKI